MVVLIAGPRSSGKRPRFPPLSILNRRRDHVITIENEIQVVHESRGSMISQREVRGEGLLAAIVVALREDPDVLAIEELRGDGIMQAVLDAAGSGRLVIAGLSAHSAADAVDRVFDRFAEDQRLHAQLALAENLRGVIVQTLLRKPGGGRVARVSAPQYRPSRARSRRYRSSRWP
jgi:twitching motility protein PilT